jgi:hypothetical protein
MKPKLLVLETFFGDACLNAQTFLDKCGCDIYLSTLCGDAKQAESSKKYCNELAYYFVPNCYIMPIPEEDTTPRLGLYTNLYEQHTCYFQYYLEEYLKVTACIDDIINRVCPTHILVNLGLINMYHIFVKFYIAKYSNVFYYRERPYCLNSNYCCINQVASLPIFKKFSVTPKSIYRKRKLYSTYFTRYVKFNPSIFALEEVIYDK